MPRKARPRASQLDLVPLADVDLIRFERNLLRIGFFAAQEERKGKPPYIRRIEASFTRDGHRMIAAIEFEGTRGLPSTADRDKYMAFMKLADEQRERHGPITNPIRFTGYRLLQELGLTDSGENYEDINSWGERMTSTTITSRQVVFLAQSKRYANKTIHVFDSFQRVGKETGSGRSEEYEVVLSDWLLDNLNSDYAIPENFTAYKQLKRPTAKGIFAPLHWWFSSNGCRVFEKDYKELCVLLGIQAYTYISEIKRTMGKALDELKALRYISRWDIQPMAAKEGYKIILWPGDDLIKSLNQFNKKLPGDARAERSLESFAEATGESKEAKPNAELTMDAQLALSELVALGITPAKAQSLLKKYDPGRIQDTAEYVGSLVQSATGKKIQNPAGLLIYHLESEIPVPAPFVTSRQRKAAETARHERSLFEQQRISTELSYVSWAEEQVERELASRFPDEALDAKLSEIVAQRVKTDLYFKRVTPDQRKIIARQVLAKEIREELVLPSLEQWSKTNSQGLLFES